MARRGRKPTGAALVKRLQGSEHAKDRLELILETVSGQKTIPEACQALGIQESMFHKMRSAVLQTALNRLEPRPRGRRPRPVSAEAQRVAELENELTQLRLDLAAAEIRRELAEKLPRLRSRLETGTASGHGPASASMSPQPAAGPGKKTTRSRRNPQRRLKKRRK